MGGRDKAFLRIGERTSAERILERLAPLFPRVLVSSNRPDLWAPLGLPAVADLFPGAGPLAGLHAGTLAAERDGADAVFALACDLPFVSPDAVRRILDAARGHAAAAGTLPDAVVPRIAARVEPLHAFYLVSAARAAEECLRAGQNAMTDLLDSLPRVVMLEETDFAGIADLALSFRNVNTPEDLAEAERLLARRP